jgi:hypothetical protein
MLSSGLRRTLEGLRREVRPNTASQRGLGDEPAGKPDSVLLPEQEGDHPSATAVASSLVRSTRRLGRAALERLRRRADASL